MIDKIKSMMGFGEPTDYSELVNNGALILDVRSKGEFRGGNVKGSVNIPVNELQSRVKELKDKDQVIITCCASGMRSGSAKTFLEQSGFKTVHNAGGWNSLDWKLNNK